MTEQEALFFLAQAGLLSAQKFKLLLNGAVSFERLLVDPQSYRSAFPDLMTEEWLERLKTARAATTVEQLQQKCALQSITILTILDADYPSALKEIHDPPPVLYIKGKFLEADQAAIAVVGARAASSYGLKTAHQFASKLAEAGITVVSGMARGIDTEAHHGALNVRGRTIAVLGSGLDVIYPRENKKLFAKIAASGVVVSEFPLGTPPLAFHFPVRNRLIAGLSMGVLVVEAHQRSGSLITASCAIDEGREVYAVPGRIDSFGSQGTHELIRQGARLVVSPEDLLSDLRSILREQLRTWTVREDKPVIQIQHTAHLSESEKEIIQLLEANPSTAHEIEEKLAPGSLRMITEMELKGLIHRRSDGRYERASRFVDVES
ncbi:MAG: DNA-protecting protein DprA [Candidatus Omnitrophica bacterium CG11_big_fil_rev_8_21_14_0_20_45_26]|uniref:DNA-protecting protein DprA n=1 Tax=Candidatus Abzuiibacterium crystallinum TaxID=1974748 RepID=A0A2H0LPM3_9BACT|nr:MAG: DNA-protecting protein DprA [Candidatus Omnitrophica bacterium CG11_big_fil_rev_8_21_14_0_20_45_26]PIW65165.1 MAG: DNA-protecting protein DprA [Candidatus Omnitrophica bacterium CG12_big_fil_rev_8_21_14_0_65_45_16]